MRRVDRARLADLSDVAPAASEAGRLKDAPDPEPTERGEWAEFRINATTYRSYDTRRYDKPGWTRAMKPNPGHRDNLYQGRLRTAALKSGRDVTGP